MSPQIFKLKIHPFTLTLAVFLTGFFILTALTGLYKTDIFKPVFELRYNLQNIDTAGPYLLLCILITVTLLFKIVKTLSYRFILYPDRIEEHCFGIKIKIPMQSIKGYKVTLYKKSGSLKKITLVLNDFIFPYGWHFKKDRYQLLNMLAFDPFVGDWCVNLENLNQHQ